MLDSCTTGGTDSWSFLITASEPIVAVVRVGSIPAYPGLALFLYVLNLSDWIAFDLFLYASYSMFKRGPDSFRYIMPRLCGAVFRNLLTMTVCDLAYEVLAIVY